MFKLVLETVNPDEPSILDGVIAWRRDNALSVFDRARQAEQRRNALGQSWYTNITLLTDDPAEAPNGWESSDPEFPWVVDGESFPAFEDCPRGCGVRVRTDQGWKIHFDFECPVIAVDDLTDDLGEGRTVPVTGYRCDYCGNVSGSVSDSNDHMILSHPDML